MESKEKVGVLKALSLLVQLGLSLALPLVLMVWLGQLVGRQLGQENLLLVISIFLGLGAGMVQVYRIVSKEIDS